MSNTLWTRHGGPRRARAGKDETMGQGDRTPHADAPREIDESTRDDASDATLTAAILRIGASLDLDTVRPGALWSGWW